MSARRNGWHPAWDGSGAALLGGRWNSPGNPVIYGSPTHACAMLEILAHAGTGCVPGTRQFVMAELPDNEPLVGRHGPDDSK